MLHFKNCLREFIVNVSFKYVWDSREHIFDPMWNFIDGSEIFPTRSIPTFLCRRQESPSIVRVKIQWTGAIERTMAYISFFLTLRRLEIWHDSSISILPIMRHGSRFNISHLFFLGVLSSPESHVDPFLFNVVLCTSWVRA